MTTAPSAASATPAPTAPAGTPPTASTEPPAPPSAFDDQLTARLLHQRIVVVGTEIDDAVANRVCAQLLLLSAEDPRADVALYVNSPGGSVSAGLAVYDTMRLLPNDVATVGFGLTASMGQFLLTAGTKGKRYVLPHTRVLMHQPSAGIGGTAVDIAIQAENLAHTKRVVHELTARHTGRTVEQVTADADRDRWFTAQEAVEYGLADRIVETVEDVRPTAAGRKAGL
ncbi:ClpP family protease [Puerhibacterium sp. TATVAM-FAB25]|uniref:ClpP family protease n=1 Tax=Puerhibacterium sp. TATVAM-FAB25 TaxID=3093699 RepID=UPI0039798FAB